MLVRKCVEVKQTTRSSQVKALPVSAGHFSMKTNSLPLGGGAISALQEYTSAMFGYTPQSASFFEHAKMLIDSRGKVDACKRLKEYFVISSKLACGLPYNVDQSLSWIATDASGFPKALKAFKQDLAGKDLNRKRAVLTLLSCFRLIR